MKQYTLRLLAALLLITGFACTREVNEPIPDNLKGKWILTDIQAPGIGPLGVWSVANPAGRWMELNSSTHISGTAFPNSSTFHLLDSVTLTMVDPTQSANFRKFRFKVDSANQVLYLYILPPGNVFCTEGCGGYKFSR
jgi:hypothetical protein